MTVTARFTKPGHGSIAGEIIKLASIIRLLPLFYQQHGKELDRA